MSHTLLNFNTMNTVEADIVSKFQEAIANKFNLRPGFGTTDFWNFVESDMYVGLREIYSSRYIDECFEYLADLEMEDRAAEINALKFA